MANDLTLEQLQDLKFKLNAVLGELKKEIQEIDNEINNREKVG